MPVGTAMGAMVWAELGFSSLMQGDADRASEYFDSGLSVSTAPKLLARPQLLLGRALLAMSGGEGDEAAALIAEAEAFALDHGMAHYAPYFGLVRGMLLSGGQDLAAANDELKNACMIASEMGMRPVALQASITRAGLFAGTGDTLEAAAAVQEAERVINEIAGSIEQDDIRESFTRAAYSKLPGS